MTAVPHTPFPPPSRERHFGTLPASRGTPGTPGGALTVRGERGNRIRELVATDTHDAVPVSTQVHRIEVLQESPGKEMGGTCSPEKALPLLPPLAVKKPTTDTKRRDKDEKRQEPKTSRERTQQRKEEVKERRMPVSAREKPAVKPIALPAIRGAVQAATATTTDVPARDWDGSPKVDTQSAKYKTIVMANGGVLDLTDMSDETIRQGGFAVEEIHNIKPSIAKAAVSRRRRSKSQALKPLWHKNLAEELDADRVVDEGGSPVSPLTKVRGMKTGASFRTAYVPLERVASVLKSVKKLRRKSRQVAAARPPAESIATIPREVTFPSNSSDSDSDVLIPSGTEEEGFFEASGSRAVSDYWRAAEGRRRRSSLRGVKARAVPNNMKGALAEHGEALSLLPCFENCQSATGYVEERIALLRKSNHLRTSFEAVCKAAQADKKIEIERRIEELDERRGISHLEPVDIAASARHRDKNLAETKERRLDICRQVLSERQGLVQHVRQRQLRADAVRSYVHSLPVLVRRWQTALCAFKMAEAVRVKIAEGYRDRWKTLKILYMARWWQQRTRLRRERIGQLRCNMFIRRQLPLMLHRFRRKRRIEAIPLLARFLTQWVNSVRLIRIMQKFQASVKKVQKFLRLRRMAKLYVKTAMLLQWDYEHEHMTTNELSMTLPTAYRDRVIEAVIRRDLIDHFDRRREAVDAYITALEQTEKEMVEENQRLLREQEAQMATLVAGASPTMKRQQEEFQAGLQLEPIFTLSGPNATDARRKFVVIFVTQMMNKELTEQYKTAIARQQFPVSGTRSTKKATVSGSGSPQRHGPHSPFASFVSQRQRLRSTVAHGASPRLLQRGPHPPTDAASRGTPEPGMANATGRHSLAEEAIFATERQWRDPFDLHRMPIDNPYHPLFPLFQKVKRPRLARRRMLTSRAAIRRLITAAREAFSQTWRAHLSSVYGQGSDLSAMANREAAAAIASAMTGSDIANEVDLGFVDEYLAHTR